MYYVNNLQKKIEIFLQIFENEIYNYNPRAIYQNFEVAPNKKPDYFIFIFIFIIRRFNDKKMA